MKAGAMRQNIPGDAFSARGTGVATLRGDVIVFDVMATEMLLLLGRCDVDEDNGRGKDSGVGNNSIVSALFGQVDGTPFT